MRAQANRIEDKRYLKNLSRALDISDGRIKLDECGDWNIVGKRGYISTDTEYWYLYVKYENSNRKWSNTKESLNFMEVHQDGDDEGVLRLDRLPFRDEAMTVRKVIGVRPRTVLTEEGRALIRERFIAPAKGGFQEILCV